MLVATLSPSEYRVFHYAISRGYYQSDDDRAIWRMRSVLKWSIRPQVIDEEWARRVLDEHYQAKRIAERWQLRQRQHTGD